MGQGGIQGPGGARGWQGEYRGADLVVPPLCRSLDSLSGRGRGSPPPTLPIADVILSLQDLIGYFQPPPAELQHEQRQSRLRALRGRQNLFQQEVGPPPHPGLRGVMGLGGSWGWEVPGLGSHRGDAWGPQSWLGVS